VGRQLVSPQSPNLHGWRQIRRGAGAVVASASRARLRSGARSCPDQQQVLGSRNPRQQAKCGLALDMPTFETADPPRVNHRRQLHQPDAIRILFQQLSPPVAPGAPPPSRTGEATSRCALCTFHLLHLSLPMSWSPVQAGLYIEPSPVVQSDLPSLMLA
jgi:hypothetical protein